jgi:type II restriction enzyme
MDLGMNIALAEGYKAPPQIARVVTEAWFLEQMYCPACPSPHLTKTRDNTRVVDFICENCHAEFQLKAKSDHLGKRLRDAAYGPMRERISSGLAPHFAFLVYDRATWSVTSLLFVPGHFLTLSAIEPCKPLSASARRAGWVGCNILTTALPEDGKVFIVSDGRVSDRSTIREKWCRFSWLSDQPAEVRAWAADVLKCVQQIGRKRFSLDDVYSFRNELSRLHPKNNNIEAKIRQQLQILRDRGILRFLSRGEYETC